MNRCARHLALLVSLAALALSAWAGTAPDARGEEKARAAVKQRRSSVGEKALRPPRDPQRVGQWQMVMILQGELEQAMKACKDALQKDPSDLESAYNLVLAQAQAGKLEEAAATMKASIERGLPPGRFLAGPRKLTRPLADTKAFRDLAGREALRLVHGPMLGCVTDRSASFWVRTADETHVQVLVSTAKDLADPITSSTVSTDAKQDFTALAEVQKLQPATLYYYDVTLDGRSALGPGFPSFRTFPPEGKPAEFKIGFGGGAGYHRKFSQMWEVLTRHRLSAFLFLGDNVYIDHPTLPEVQQYTYYRRQSEPEYRRFVRTTPIYAIYDDHDLGTNDFWGGPKRDDPAWKVPAWQVFRRNWNNPGYGGGEKSPGCWFRFSIADVDFFMLDGRYWRTSPKAEQPSMLGPVQKKWLFDELKRADGTFKVLCSPVPWVLEAKGKSLDTWRGFQKEREEIFANLEENRIDGVILLSADRHRSDVWRIDRPNGYPLWEFESSRLTNVHTHGLMPGALFGYNEKCSFGQLTFDTKRADPKVTYQIYSIDDELIHTVSVTRSQIEHK